MPSTPFARSTTRFTLHPEWVAGAMVSLVVVVFVRETWQFRAHLDDAYIAYRYAKNLAAGHGLVWNLGERVEGFTSLAWVLLVALGMKLGFDAPVTSHALEVVFGALSLLLTYLYARIGLSRRDHWVAALSPWLLFCSTSFGIWTTAGLETPLYVAAVTLSLLLSATGRHGVATAAAVLATLARPDGALVAAVVLAAQVIARGWRSPRAWLLPALYAGFILGLTAFRLAYFGAPLPNTFYAKVGTVPRLMTFVYIAGFFVRLAVPVAIPAVFGARHEPAFRSGAACVVLTLVYVAAVGGDVFEHDRFFLPVLPAILAMAVRGGFARRADDRVLARMAVVSIPVTFLWYLWGPAAGAAALVVGAGSALVRTGVDPRARAALLGACALGAAAFVHRALPRPPKMSTPLGGLLAQAAVFSRQDEIHRHQEASRVAAEAAEQIVQRLSRRKPPVRLLALGGIGVAGYYSNARVLDILGLTDAVIARSTTPTVSGSFALPGHQRSNASYVLSSDPDYIFIPRRGQPAAFLLPCVIDLWNHPDLERKYVWDPIAIGYRRRGRPP